MCPCFWKHGTICQCSGYFNVLNFCCEHHSEQADSVLSQHFEVRGQTRILRCEVVEGGRERGTRHLLNEAKI